MVESTAHSVRNKVIQSEWKSLEKLEIKLVGMNLDSVWENIIVQIGGVKIAADEERAKLNQCIEQFDKQARIEKQPRRKWELAEEMRKVKYDGKPHI